MAAKWGNCHRSRAEHPGFWVRELRPNQSAAARSPAVHHNQNAQVRSSFEWRVFGELGKRARSAFGVAQIPLDAHVEIELIAELAAQ